MKKRIYLFTIAAVAILIAVAVGFCIWKNSNVAEVDAPLVPKLSEEVITEPSSTEIPETEAVFKVPFLQFAGKTSNFAVKNALFAVKTRTFFQNARVFKSGNFLFFERVFYCGQKF